MKFEITQASEKGRRSYQEDRHVVYQIPEEGCLLAVFDGHGGSEAAEYCAKNVVSIFRESYERGPGGLSLEDVLREVFKILHEKTSYMGPGCAASIAFIPVNGVEAVVGILGDAPILIRNMNGELWRAPEHNVRSNVVEAALARKRGGFIQNGYLFSSYLGTGLQMSRALGDANLDSVLSREPEIFRIATGPDSFVLVASDGLFDPAHGTKPLALDKFFEAHMTADNLVQGALAVPTHDNVTAILVKFSEN